MAVIWKKKVIQILLTSNVIDSSACSHLFLKFACVKIQSCRNKTVQNRDFITDNDFDILFMTETWLLYVQAGEAYITEMTNDGCQFYLFSSFAGEVGALPESLFVRG